MADRPAILSPMASAGFPVWLSPRGVEMCLAALVKARRDRARGNGGAPVTDDFRWLVEVLRLAADAPVGAADEPQGFADETESGPVSLVLRSSAALVGSSVGRGHLTTRSAAELIGISEQAVRRACSAGRLEAERVGRAWMVDERAARSYAERRGRGRGDGGQASPGG